MKNLIALLFLFVIYNPLFSQRDTHRPVIQKLEKSYNVVYSDDAKYRYVLNTKEISTLKPNTEYLKVLTFESEKKAILEIISNSEEVDLVDNEISKTMIKQKRVEIPFDVQIIDNKITLTNNQTKQKIQLKIEGIYDDIFLQDIKTKELYISGNPAIEKSKSRPVPLYMPKKQIN